MCIVYFIQFLQEDDDIDDCLAIENLERNENSIQMEIHNDENNIENNNLNANAANGHNENDSGVDAAVDGTNTQQNISPTENVVTEDSANNKSIEANEITLGNGLIQREQNEMQNESTVAVVVTSESDEQQSLAKNQNGVNEPVSNENE